MTSRCGWILSACVVLAASSAMYAASPTDAKKTIPVDCFGDPLPDGAVARMGTVRFRHAGAASFVGYLPDGKTILSIGGDHTMRWWDAGSGKEIRRRPVSVSIQGGAALSLDRKVLAAPVGYGDVGIWDALTGKELRKLEAPDVSLQAIALSADGKMLVTGGESVLVWNATSGARIRVLASATKSFAAAVLSPDGATLISAGQDGAVRWWDVASGKLVAEDKGKDGYCLSALSADGKCLATYGLENVLKLWDAGSRMASRSLPPTNRGERVLCLTFSPDNKLLAAGCDDGVVRLYDATSGEELRRCEGRQGAVLALAFSPNGATLVSGGLDGAVRQWDVASGKEIHPFAGSLGVVGALAVSPDGATVASGGAEGRVHLWNPITGEERRSLAGCAGEEIAHLGFSSDGKTVSSVSCNGGSAVHVWNTVDGKALHSFSLADKGYPFRFVLSPDAAVVAAFDRLGRIALFDANKGVVIWEYAEPGKGSLEFGAFVGPGDTLAAFHHCGGPISKTDAFLLWDVGTGVRVLQPLRADLGAVYGCAASPDGKTLGVVGADGRMSLWNVATGDSIRAWNASKDFILATAFSADGRMIATSDLEASVSVWEAATGQRRGVFRGGQGFIDALAFSPDGERLYCGGHDGTVLAWDLTGRSAGVDASAGEPDEKTLEKLWNDLGSGDAVLAYRAVWKLAAAPERSAPFLSACLNHPAATPALIARWIGELDSDDFDARERASAALRRAELMAEPYLKTAQAAYPAPEARRRIEELLDWLKKVRKGVHPPEPQVARAIEALEDMRTPTAKEELARLAEGPDTSLIREAKAALERMHRRPAAKPPP